MRRHIQLFVMFMLSINVLWTAFPTYGGTGFTGPYEMQNWSVTASGGGTTSITPSSGSAESAAFRYDINLGLPGPGVSYRTWTFSTTAASTGSVTFDWQYDFYHAWYHVEAVFQTYAVTSSGMITATELNFYNDDYTGNQSRSGTATIEVEEGRPFGFIIGGSNFDLESHLLGILTITNFEYSDPEPELEPEPGPEPIQDVFEDSIETLIMAEDNLYGWFSVYDISYNTQIVTVNLDIQLNWIDPVDSSIRQAREDQWESGIEDIWSNKYVILDENMFQYSMIFDVNWVDINPHHTVNVYSRAPTGGEWVSMLNWYTDIELTDEEGNTWGNELQDEMAAHEAGHMFGLYDEYEPYGALAPEPIIDYNSIMGSLFGRPQARHYQGILDWLAGESGRQLSLFSMLPPSAPGYSPPRIIDFYDPMPLQAEAPVPEPSTLGLVVLGLLAATITTKNHRRRM